AVRDLVDRAGRPEDEGVGVASDPLRLDGGDLDVTDVVPLDEGDPIPDEHRVQTLPRAHGVPPARRELSGPVRVEGRDRVAVVLDLDRPIPLPRGAGVVEDRADLLPEERGLSLVVRRREAAGVAAHSSPSSTVRARRPGAWSGSVWMSMSSSERRSGL